ncbi:hypothetical protein OSB04_007805 [Centaurea solstitialis]|uniref:ATP-dependent DNA helicase n=1 Tax=Centaurea solstitialis TaxID=347529 RepID=A0AA38TX74_9ASTR|nr:hypothetical protein OSB04_007805 [Centaurea solstitialis]
MAFYRQLTFTPLYLSYSVWGGDPLTRPRPRFLLHGPGPPYPPPAPLFATRPRPRAGTGIPTPSPAHYPVNPRTMDEKNITLIDNLDIQKDDFTVNVRIIRLWSQPLFKDPEQLYSIEMILMDEEYHIHNIFVLIFNVFLSDFDIVIRIKSKLISLGNRVMEAEIISGSNIGNRTFIPRMSLTPTDKRIPFKFQRRQFPVSLCFAMTINKSQGLTLSNVGLFLRQPVFTHGQLYVVLSRVKSREGLKVLIIDDEGIISNRTKNVVYKEVFGSL